MCDIFFFDFVYFGIVLFDRPFTISLISVLTQIFSRQTVYNVIFESKLPLFTSSWALLIHVWKPWSLPSQLFKCKFYSFIFCGIYCHDVMISVMVTQITSFAVVYSTVYSGADQTKHQTSASLAFVRGIHQWPVNSPHKGPVTRKMFPFDDVIMYFARFKKHRVLIWQKTKYRNWPHYPITIVLHIVDLICDTYYT